MPDSLRPGGGHEARLSKLYRPATLPNTDPELALALGAIEALLGADDGGDDLRRHTARHMLRAATLYNAGLSAREEMRAVLSVWIASPDGFPALGLAAADVRALIGCDPTG